MEFAELNAEQRRRLVDIRQVFEAWRTGNDKSLWWFVAEVLRRWLKTLKRRSQTAFLRSPA